LNAEGRNPADISQVSDSKVWRFLFAGDS